MKSALSREDIKELNAKDLKQLRFFAKIIRFFTSKPGDGGFEYLTYEIKRLDKNIQKKERRGK